MKLDRQAMLAALAEDLVNEYPLCVDLLRAGDGGWVEAVDCFAADALRPREGYILLEACRGGLLRMIVRTGREDLLGECLAYLDGTLHRFAEIELRASHRSVFAAECLHQRFVVEPSDYPDNPAYVIRAPGELRDAEGRLPVGEAARMGAADRAALLEDAASGLLDREGIGPDLFGPRTGRRAAEWYLLRVGDEPAAYLRADCVIPPVREIGWLYVEKKYRGTGCAADLVRFFTRDVYARGGIPRYGWAVSPESARVAEACGYTRLAPAAVCCTLLPRE